MGIRLGYSNFVNGGPRDLSDSIETSKLHANSDADHLGNRRVGLRVRFIPTYYIHSATSGTATKNDQVKFDEGGGTLTATLTAGTYSMDELATEIKARMHAVGGQSYTVTFNDSTGKFTISAAAGFSLLAGTSDFAALANPWMGFTAGDLGSATTHTSDAIIRNMGHFVKCELTTATGVDMLAAYKMRFATTNGDSVSPSSELTNVNINIFGHASDLGDDPRLWADSASYSQAVGPLASGTLPDINQLWAHIETSTTTAYKWWYLEFDDQVVSPGDYAYPWLEIGYLYLGTNDDFDSTGGTGSCPPTVNLDRVLVLDDKGGAAQSQGGQSFQAKVPKRYTETVSVSNVSAADWDLMADAAEVIGSTESAIWVFDDTATLTDGRTVWFGRWMNAATFQRRGVNDHAEVQFKVRQSQD